MNSEKKLQTPFHEHFKHCIIREGNYKEIILEENKKKYKAINTNHIFLCAFDIDGCIITSTKTKKCDKGLITQDNKFYLIEFKGSDISTACSQLFESLKFFKQQYSQYQYFCRAILSKAPSKKSAPNLKPTSQKILEKELNMQKTKNSFIVASKFYEEVV